MPISDYSFQSAIGGDEPAKQRDQILADATPQPPAAPLTDHPMVQFARNLLSPMYPQGFNPRAIPQGQGFDSPDALGSAVSGTVGTAWNAASGAARLVPGVAGLSDALTAPGHPAQPGEYGEAFGQKVMYRTGETVGQGPLAWLGDNPAALGPGSAILDPFAGASEAIAGARALKGAVTAGAEGIVRSAPAFAADEAGMARIDLGMLGPDSGSSGGGLRQRLAAAEAARNPGAAANDALVAAKGEAAIPGTGGAVARQVAESRPQTVPAPKLSPEDMRALYGVGATPAERAALSRQTLEEAQAGFDAAAGRGVRPPEPPKAPTPEPPPSPERPVNPGVNLDKIDAPQPVKDLIEQTAIENAGFEAQRRGVVSVEETMADAAKAQVEASKYAFIRPGTALNAEELTALKGAMVSKGTEVAELQEKVRAAAAVNVTSRELNMQLTLAAAEHSSLQKAFAGVRAESGRALRIQREYSGALASGKGVMYDRAVNAIGGRANEDALIQKLQDIWTNPELDDVGRQRATFQFINGLDSPKFFDRINALWVNSILYSPVTHAVNVTGQAILLQTDIVRKALAAGVDTVTSAGGLARPREVYFTEPLAEEFGALSGLGDGFKRALTMLRHGISPEAMTKFAETGGTQREVNAGILNVPLRALGAEDQVFYAMGYSRGLHGTAAKIASRERQGFLSGAWADRVSTLLQNPTEEMLTAAEAAGKRAGLRTDAGMSELIRLRDKGVTIGPLGKFSPLKYIIPFVNTPTLLVKIGAEYSPLGFIGAVRGSTGAARSEALAGALIGSTAMAFLAGKYAEGNITGAAPAIPAERDAFYAEGKIPFAVKLGDEWVSFNRLEPIATPLKWTAAMLDAAKANQGQPGDVVASKMAFAFLATLKNETFLSSMSNFIDALSGDPTAIGKVLPNIVGGFVPAAVRTGVQANDPFIRDPNGIVEQIESTFPGLNENVPTKIDVYGQPVKRSQGKQGISGVISPVDFNPAQGPDPVTEKVNSLHLPEMAGQPGVRELQVGYVSKEIASYRLNTDEAARYQQYAGQATHNLLTALFADQRPYDDQPFSKLSPVDQIRAVRKTIDDARTVGRAQVADEVIAAAKSSTDVSRGADMRISTLSTRKDRAYFLQGLDLQGKLTSDVRAYLDGHSDKGEPTAAEYVKNAPLIKQYLALPPYTIGDPQEWAQLATARKVMTAFLKTSPAPLGWTQIDWFSSHNPQAGLLVRRYSYDYVANPKRAALLKANPSLSSFLP